MSPMIQTSITARMISAKRPAARLSSASFQRSAWKENNQDINQIHQRNDAADQDEYERVCHLVSAQMA
jgi:hypothetical protein